MKRVIATAALCVAGFGVGLLMSLLVVYTAFAAEAHDRGRDG